jgi:hypothetical protein
MSALRPGLLALLPLVVALAAHADPPPVFFPQAPIVTQPVAQAPQAPAVQQPFAPVAAPVAQPAVRPAAPPQVAQPAPVPQPQVVAVQPIQMQAPAQPQAAVVYVPADPAAAQAAQQAALQAPGEPQRAWLAPGAPPPVATAESGPSPWRALSVLLVVLAIGGGALYVQRTKGGGAMAGILGARGSGGLRVVDSVRVGPRAQLVVAEFGGRRFLVGVNDTSIRRVAYLGRSGAAAQGGRAAAAQESPIDVPAPGGFTEAMRRALASSASQPVSPVAPSQPQHPVATTPAVPSVNAADLLASETRDVVDLGAGARMSRVLATRDGGNSPRPADVYTRTPGPANVEEQVAGLARRRIPRRG